MFQHLCGNYTQLQIDHRFHISNMIIINHAINMQHIAIADNMIPIGGIKHIRNAIEPMSAGKISPTNPSISSTSIMYVIKVFTIIKPIPPIIKVVITYFFLI